MLRLFLEKIEKTSTVDLLKAVIEEICYEFNYDFIGENGSDYISSEAKKAGYEKDIDYHHDRLMKYLDFNETYCLVDLNQSDLTLYIQSMLEELSSGSENRKWEIKISNEIIAIAVYIRW